MLAKDIMRRKVVTVASYLTLAELAKVFQERCITGAPVVDPDGRILGVVSQTDLVRARRESSAGVAHFHLEPDMPSASVGMHFEELEGERVEDIMTPGAIAFDAETPVSVLARAMMERHIHRVLITHDGRLAGIVTSMDMLRVVADGPHKPAPRRTAKHAAKAR